MPAPTVLGVSEQEPIGVRVGEAFVVRQEREPYFTMISRAAKLLGTDQPFVLIYRD